MRYETLERCYNTIRKKYPTLQIDSWSVIKTVHDLRQYWKPPQVKIVLLAESHVYTKDSEWNIHLKSIPYLDIGYPANFVRFVYCIGYGENGYLNQYVENNNGTWQYWKILYSCLNDIRKNNCEFSPILKSVTRNEDNRIKNKIDLLKKLQKQGIWLVDSSIVGINHLQLSDRKDIIEICWQNYIEKLIKEIKPKHIVIIGKTVESVVGKSIEKMKINYSWRPQPQARLTSKEQKESFKHYYDVCNGISDNNSNPIDINIQKHYSFKDQSKQTDIQNEINENILIRKLDDNTKCKYKWTLDSKLGYYSTLKKKVPDCTAVLSLKSENESKEEKGRYWFNLEGLFNNGDGYIKEQNDKWRVIIYYESQSFYIALNRGSKRIEIPT